MLLQTPGAEEVSALLTTATQALGLAVSADGRVSGDMGPAPRSPRSVQVCEVLWRWARHWVAVAKASTAQDPTGALAVGGHTHQVSNRALALAEKALALDPGCTQAHKWYGPDLDLGVHVGAHVACGRACGVCVFATQWVCVRPCDLCARMWRVCCLSEWGVLCVVVAAGSPSLFMALGSTWTQRYLVAPRLILCTPVVAVDVAAVGAPLYLFGSGHLAAHDCLHIVNRRPR